MAGFALAGGSELAGYRISGWCRRLRARRLCSTSGSVALSSPSGPRFGQPSKCSLRRSPDSVESSSGSAPRSLPRPLPTRRARLSRDSPPTQAIGGQPWRTRSRAYAAANSFSDAAHGHGARYGQSGPGGLHQSAEHMPLDPPGAARGISPTTWCHDTTPGDPWIVTAMPAEQAGPDLPVAKLAAPTCVGSECPPQLPKVSLIVELPPWDRLDLTESQAKSKREVSNARVSRHHRFVAVQCESDLISHVLARHQDKSTRRARCNSRQRHTGISCGYSAPGKFPRHTKPGRPWTSSRRSSTTTATLSEWDWQPKS